MEVSSHGCLQFGKAFPTLLGVGDFVFVEEDGLDLFGTAANSNYFLMDQYSSLEKARIFNSQGEDDEPNSLMASGIKR